MTSETFTQTAGQLITNALRDARIIAAEQPIQAKDLIDGLQAINMIIKHWQAQGIHLWSEIEAVLPLVPAQRKYLLGPDGDEIGTAKTFFNTALTEDLVADDDVIGFNPALSTDGWTTFACTIAIVADILQSTNDSGADGRISFEFDTTIGVEYEITFEYVRGTSAEGRFDALGATLTDTLILDSSQTATIRFIADATETDFRMTNDGGAGLTNSLASVLVQARIKEIPVTATSGNTIDGQAITMNAAPGVLSADPTKTTTDWILVNSASIAADSATGLTVTDVLGDGAGVELELDTVVGTRYQLRVEFKEIVAAFTTIFSVFDSIGDLELLSFTDSTTVTLNWTARDPTTTFRAVFSVISAPADEFILLDLNYFDTNTGDRIGIELDDGSRFWDNIATVDTDTQVTIFEGIPTNASTGNTVYTYETAIARPMRLLQSRFAETITASEIPVRQWSRDEYFDQPDKDSSGTVVNWYYTPTLTLGQLFVWQVANDINQVLRFTFVDPIEIPTDTSDMLDVPSEWYMPLKWAIAAELGPSRGLPDNRQLVLESKANGTLQEAMAFDVERESLSFQPDFR